MRKIVRRDVEKYYSNAIGPMIYVVRGSLNWHALEKKKKNKINIKKKNERK